MSAAATLRWEDAYRHDSPRLRVHGRRTASTHEFRRYVQSGVRDRLRRASPRDQLRDYLKELTSTGFSIANLESVSREEAALAPWEIGEVLAELLLEETEHAMFPWPPAWDKRSATASLPGPDLIGFLGDEGTERFLFGEVKSSDAEDVHASVIYGDDGLRNQIDRLLASEDRRQVLISWLFVRAEGQAWKSRFDQCITAYLANPSTAVIVGVLLRGRDPLDSDLGPVRTAVEARISPYDVLLLGYYFPVRVDELPATLEGTADRP